MVHLLAFEICCDGDVFAFDQTPLRDGGFGFVSCNSFACNGLDEESGDVQRLGVAASRLGAKGVNGDAFDLGDVVERDRFAQ